MGEEMEKATRRGRNRERQVHLIVLRLEPIAELLLDLIEQCGLSGPGIAKHTHGTTTYPARTEVEHRCIRNDVLAPPRPAVSHADTHPSKLWENVTRSTDPHQPYPEHLKLHLLPNFEWEVTQNGLLVKDSQRGVPAAPRLSSGGGTAHTQQERTSTFRIQDSGFRNMGLELGSL